MTDLSLRELQAVFVRCDDRFEGDHAPHRPVDRIEDADGVRFLCPLCFGANGGARGTHIVICWSPSAPADQPPGPGRWALVGSSIDDLTLGPIPGKTRSVQLLGGCNWHGFVTNGRAC